MTAGSYCYIGPQGIVHGTTVCINLSVVIVVKLHLDLIEIEKNLSLLVYH